MDESGHTTVQSTQKVIASRGKKQVCAITSAERGVQCTVVCCTSSAGRLSPCCNVPLKTMEARAG